MDGKSQSISEEQRQKLRALFPEVFDEDKINWEKLKATLGSDVDLGEHYNLSWKGKSNVFKAIQEQTTKTLKPIPEESVDWDTTQNLFIEGDNLEALKILHKAYYGKVKMIYIDPPYNTTSDLIYDDNRSQPKDVYEFQAGIRDDQGMIKRTDGLKQNNGGHKHSDWLNLMYPRIYLGKKLLKQSGVMVVSIDDNEVQNLRLIMNEIFGEEGFVAQIPWRKRTAKSDVPFGISQDYEWLLIYAKDEFLAGAGVKRKYYETPDFPNTRWRLSDLTKQTSAQERPKSAFNMINPKNGKVYAFNPNRTWSVSVDTFDDYYKRGKIVFPGDYDFLKITIPAYRIFESEDKEKAFKKYGNEDIKKAISTLLPKEVGLSEDGNKDIVRLFGRKVFSFPKPVDFIKYILSIVR